MIKRVVGGAKRAKRAKPKEEEEATGEEGRAAKAPRRVIRRAIPTPPPRVGRFRTGEAGRRDNRDNTLLRSTTLKVEI